MGRKEEILYATLELAAENGMKGVSMSQIADKVGIKAPSLYNHFKSKDEIIREMYLFFIGQAQNGSSTVSMDFSKLMDKSIEEILLGSVSAYMGIVTDKNMLRFFKVLYSERSSNVIFFMVRSLALWYDTASGKQYSRNKEKTQVFHSF